MTQVGSKAYAYDPNGNMTARGSDALLYDQENRLYRVTVGGIQTDYTYNADNARVKKVVGSTTTYYVGNWYEVTNGVATKYYYFGAQRVAMKQGSTVTYLHGDHLGSTSVASNGTTGAQVSRQTYYAFGGVRTSEGALPTDYTFTGQKRDADADLMFYNARYYDANIGRFTQADTIVPNTENPQSWNRYSYVRNNPVRYTDPTGHCDPDECKWVENEDENSGWHTQLKDPKPSKPVAIPAPDPYRYMVRVAPPDFDHPLPNGNPPPPQVDGLPDDGWEWNDWPDAGPGYRNRDDPSGNIYRPDRGYKNKQGNEGEDPHWNKRRPGDKGKGEDYPPNPRWGRPGQRNHPGVYNPRTGQYDYQPTGNESTSVDGAKVGVTVAGGYIFYRIIKVILSPSCGPLLPACALSP